MTTRIATALAAAALIAAPAAAQDTAQTGQQTGQQQGQQQGQQLSQEAQRCLERLQQVDQRLAEYGYGRVGPEGYGNYGGAYRGTGSATPGATGAQTAEPTPGMAGAGRLTSPRADMQTLLRAGYIMALQGEDQGCQAVVQTAEDIGNRYQQAFESGEIDREALQTWRGEYLATAVPVSEVEQPMSIDEIIGSDVRNLRDEDLGDVDDVVLGPDGGIQYVLVARGGFLGIGQEQVPVRWEDLRVTADPYRDTLVLDVDEQAMENAPRVQSAEGSRLATDETQRQTIDSYWQDAGLGDRG